MISSTNKPDMGNDVAIRPFKPSRVWSAGERYPGMQVFQDAAATCYIGGFWHLNVLLQHVTDKELSRYANGTMQMALADINGLLVILFKSGEEEWNRVFYDPRLNPGPAEYPQIEDIEDEESEVGMLLQLYDSATGILMLNRIIALPNELTNRLHARCTELNAGGPIDVSSYQWKVRQALKKYPRPKAMLKEAKKVYTC